MARLTTEQMYKEITYELNFYSINYEFKPFFIPERDQTVFRKWIFAGKEIWFFRYIDHYYIRVDLVTKIKLLNPDKEDIIKILNRFKN